MTTNKPSRQYDYQVRHKEKGLCILCNEKAVTSTYCAKHRKEQNAAQLARYYKRKSNPKKTK